MKLNRTYPFICFYSLFLVLCEVHTSYSTLLRESGKGDFSLSHKRILETTHVSCETDCASDVGKSEEEVAIMIELFSKANFTLNFSIPNNGENFNLGIKSTKVVQSTVFLEQVNSTKAVSFDHYWVEDNNGWMKIYVYGDTLRLYKGGKAILKLFNPGDQTETVTVEFHYNGLSTIVNIFVLIAVIVTCIIWLPFGQFLISVGKTIIRKVKEVCFGIKEEKEGEPRLLETVIVNQFPGQQAAGKDEGNDKEVSDRQAEEEEKYQYQKVENKNHKNEEDVLDLQVQNVKNWDENRQNPDTPASNKKPYPSRRKLQLTADNIQDCFPEVKYEDLKGSIPQPVCFLCFDQLIPGMNCRQLYCKHIFHADCIQLWLQKQLSKNPDKAYCPNCKADMTTYESYKKTQDPQHENNL